MDPQRTRLQVHEARVTHFQWRAHLEASRPAHLPQTPNLFGKYSYLRDAIPNLFGRRLSDRAPVVSPLHNFANIIPAHPIFRNS